MIGQTLGHYRIEAKLGEGGMGVVYKARDTQLDRPVAIKVLPTGRTEDPERKRRFVQEAKAASALNHPHIVHIYGIDTVSGVDFIAMEYVEGKTLQDLIGRTGLKSGETLQYAAQIADALAAAHRAGIVHRDIKPSNIMVSGNGLVKVLDFGLAKLAEQAEADPSGPTQTMQPQTEEGTIAGTAAYMSPEQAEGKKVDARSDIFSFGSVLYEMVTGQRAFPGENRISILSAVLSKEPAPLSEAARDPVAPELQNVITRCLRKDPERRMQHLDDVKLMLEELKQESASGIQPQSRLPARRRWVGAALLPVLLVAGWFAWRARRAPESTEPLRAVSLTTLPGVERYPSFSPDGSQVAFSWNGPKQDNPDIYVQQIGSGSPVQLTSDPANDDNPVWSPDGRLIAFLRSQSGAGKSELRLIPPAGGPDSKLAEILFRTNETISSSIAWCPDSNCLVVPDSPREGMPTPLVVVSLETGGKRRLTNPQAPIVSDIHPAFSPDGRSLVFRRNVAPGLGELHWVGLAEGLVTAGEPRRLTPATLNASYPAWLPDGKEILFSASGSLWRLAVSGENKPVRLPFLGEDGIMSVISPAASGRAPRLAYVRSFVDVNLWRVETSAPGAPASSPPVAVAAMSSTRSDTNPQLSPDGRRAAFASGRSGSNEIWVADPDGSRAVKLTSMGAAMTGTPRWSSNGERIAFDSNLEGQFEIYAIPSVGGKPSRLTSHPANDHVPSFSRDGKWVYFSSNRSGDNQIWKTSVSGGETLQVTPNGGYVAFESPDGEYVYYTQTSSVASALWRLPTAGGTPLMVLDGVLRRAFKVLDKGIYYIDRLAGEARLQFFDFASGKSTIVARNLGEVYWGLTASPDGRTILYSRVDSSVDDLMLVENFR